MGTEPIRGKAKITLFEPKEVGDNITFFSTFNLNYFESLYNIQYQQHGNKLYFIVNSMRVDQGVKIFNASELILDKLKPGNKLTAQVIEIVDERTGTKYENPRELKLNTMDGRTFVLFYAYGQRVSKFEGYNLYLAQKNNNVWTAKRISTTKKFCRFS